MGSIELIKSTGKLIYDPIRPGVRKTGESLILQPAWDDTDLLYAWFIKRRYGLKLQRPVWYIHITVVSIKENPRKEAWKKYDGEYIDFEYSPEVYQVWKFWSLPVVCSRLEAIRIELGLSSKPRASSGVPSDFHMTIGRMF